MCRSRMLAVVILAICVGCSERTGESGGGANTTAPGVAGVPDGTSVTPVGNTDQPASGTISGLPFRPDQITFGNSELQFRVGKDIFPDAEISMRLPDAEGDLTGKEWKLGDDQFRSPMISVSWSQGKDLPDSKFLGPGEYSLSIRVIRQTATELEGIIDLSLSAPPNSRFSGRFLAAVSKSPFASLGPEDAPYVEGKIEVPLSDEPLGISAVIVAQDSDIWGLSNMAGGQFTSGDQSWISSDTHKPQITAVTTDEQSVVRYRHVKLPPGKYLIGFKRNDILAGWKLVTVAADDQLTVDLRFEPAMCGSLTVSISDEEASDAEGSGVLLTPAAFRDLGLATHVASSNAFFENGAKSVTFSDVPAGRYLVEFKERSAEVEIEAGKESSVMLLR